MSSHTLNWGNTHSLVLHERGGGLKATLMIRKPNGKQNLPLTLLPPISLSTVMEAWAAQQQQWDEIVLCADKRIFTAVRAIWLPTGALIWNVLHMDDAPYDTFGLTDLTKSNWHSKFAAKITMAIESH